MIIQGRIYGGSFDPHNRNNPRAILANWVPDGARALDIGSGDGVISRWLKQAKHCHTVGVEVVNEAAQKSTDAFDNIILGNIEDPETIKEAFLMGPYDAVILGELLEHLIDPWNTLSSIKPLLAPSGNVLFSVPNIAHWAARYNLLFGRFDYTERQLMDRTHLRWFTWRTAREMARQAGFCILDEACTFRPRYMRLFPTLFAYSMIFRLGVSPENNLSINPNAVRQ